MTDINRSIAEWLGLRAELYTGVWIITNTDDTPVFMPDWEHSDSDAIKLLPVLVEKGYSWTLHHNPYSGLITFKIYHAGECLTEGYEPTIASAICAAIMELIRKESDNG